MKNRGNGFHAANAAATDIGAGCKFAENALYGLRLTGSSSSALVEAEVGPGNANGVLVSNRAHALLRRCKVGENLGHGVQLNSWACVVMEGGEVLQNGKKSVKLSSSARNKQGYLTLAGKQRPILKSQSPCTASFGCKSRAELGIATSLGALYFLLAPLLLVLCLVVRGETQELLQDTVATTAVGLHVGSGLVWLVLLPIVSTCGIELEVNTPSYIRHIETVAGFAQVNGLALFCVRIRLFWSLQPSLVARFFCVVMSLPPVIILFFCLGFLIVCVFSPLINCIARRRQCCGIVDDGQQAINTKKCWEDLRMTGLSVMLYMWVVGPLAYVLSHAGGSPWPWKDHPLFCIGLLVLFACHAAQALASMLDPRWSLFWGFTPESSWRQQTPPPDLLLLTRSYTGGGSGRFIPDQSTVNASSTTDGSRCKGLYSWSNTTIIWALAGESLGYLVVVASNSGSDGVLWGDDAVDTGATFLFLASGLFPLLLTVLSAWDIVTHRYKALMAASSGNGSGPAPPPRPAADVDAQYEPTGPRQPGHAP